MRNVFFLSLEKDNVSYYYDLIVETMEDKVFAEPIRCYPRPKECFEGLDDIIVDLQSGELSLEDSFKKYEEGMKLIKKCTETIDKVEKKLIVVENEHE